MPGTEVIVYDDGRNHTVATIQGPEVTVTGDTVTVVAGTIEVENGPSEAPAE